MSSLRIFKEGVSRLYTRRIAMKIVKHFVKILFPFQYDNNKPYYGICRLATKRTCSPFQVADFESATPWWIAWKYVNDWQGYWTDANFLAEQWKNDNFASFKNLLRECMPFDVIFSNIRQTCRKKAKKAKKSTFFSKKLILF